ncbi:MAG TPA: hypothetical protein VMU06_00285, partial [Stellaceae bacterium]|nr:hypothetical protein [Stellaceae bacterium]
TKRITIGLDLAKHVFQVHGVDVSGAVTLFVSLAHARSALAAWMEDYNPASWRPSRYVVEGNRVG